MCISGGWRCRRTFSASVGVVLRAPVAPIQALLCILLSFRQMYCLLRAGYHTRDPYVIIGLTIAVYNHRTIFGFSPHFLWNILQTGVESYRRLLYPFFNVYFPVKLSIQDYT